MITLEDIARETGVSVATVSLALSKRGIDARTGHRRISQETENRIHAVAARLGYLPNIMARGMRKKQTFMVALVVNSIATSFYGSIIEGITNAIEPKGYNLLICHSNHDHEREHEHLRHLHRRQIDGVVIAPVLREGDSRLQEGIESFKGKPVLLLGYNPIAHPFALTYDDFQGSVTAVRHLYELGHRSIAYVPASLDVPHQMEEVMRWIPVRQRYDGYQQIIADLGLRQEVVLELSALVEGLRQRRFTALIASTDEVAAQLYPMLRSAGFSIPRDVSIISVGDTPIANLLEPPLTTISQPKAALGQQAGAMMIQAIESRKFSQANLSMQLVKRQSCATAPRSQTA